MEELSLTVNSEYLTLWGIDVKRVMKWGSWSMGFCAKDGSTLKVPFWNILSENSHHHKCINYLITLSRLGSMGNRLWDRYLFAKASEDEHLWVSERNRIRHWKELNWEGNSAKAFTQSHKELWSWGGFLGLCHFEPRGLDSVYPHPPVIEYRLPREGSDLECGGLLKLRTVLPRLPSWEPSKAKISGNREGVNWVCVRESTKYLLLFFFLLSKKIKSSALSMEKWNKIW